MIRKATPELRRAILISIALHIGFLCILAWLALPSIHLGRSEGGVVEVAIDDGNRRVTPELRSEGTPRQRGDERAQAAGPAGSKTNGNGRGEEDPILSAIRHKIEREKFYPNIARQKGWEGTAQIRFRIDDAGRVYEVMVTKPSGNDMLDQAALATVKRSSPLPPYPEPITVSLCFSLAD